MDGMIGATLERITRSSHLLPQVRKEELSPGDWVIVRTLKSEYRLKILGNGLVHAGGGWFDRKGHAPMTIGVSGATWGGSAIMPGVFAAVGMRVEFRNRLITSPVRQIVIIKYAIIN
jgi:hypothetical protein